MDNNQPIGSVDISESSVMIYITPGPLFDNFDPKKKYDNVISEVIAMEIHSSIESFYRYGFVVIPDRIGMRESLSLTGNEIITVRYSNSVATSLVPPKSIHFNIYDMEEVALNNEYKDRYTNKAIKLHLIEAPFFLTYNMKVWSKVYGKDYGTAQETLKLNKIFENHLINDLKITNTNIVSLDLNDMSTDMYWINPSWKSQKMFSYLLQFARDTNNNGNVKFFTTSDVFEDKIILNLKSVNQMFDVKNLYQYTIVNVGPLEQSGLDVGQRAPKSLNHIIDFKLKSYDLLSLTSGLPGGYIYNRDYLSNKRFIQLDNYASTNRTEKYFSNNALWLEDISAWDNAAYTIGSMPINLAKAYLNNKIIDQKYQLKCLADCYLNHERNCGDKVNIIFPPAGGAIDNAKYIDEHMSGDWIIQEMIDVITNNRGYTNITFIKDSFYYDHRMPGVEPIQKITFKE